MSPPRYLGVAGLRLGQVGHQPGRQGWERGAWGEAAWEGLGFSAAFGQGSLGPLGKPVLPHWCPVFTVSSWTDPALCILVGFGLKGKQEKTQGWQLCGPSLCLQVCAGSGEMTRFSVPHFSLQQGGDGSAVSGQERDPPGNTWTEP